MAERRLGERKREREKNGRRRITHTDTPFPNDILSSTFDISRVLNSLGLHAHALVREQHRGRTFSTWRRSRKWPPFPSPLFIFFYFPPVPQLLEISNELLLSYSTVTAFFLANGFLHASSPPPPLLTFSSYVPTLLSSPLFFPPFLLSPLLVFVLDRFRNPPPDTRRAQPSVQSQLCKRVFACVSWTQRKAVKKGKKKEKRRKRKLDTKLELRITNAKKSWKE